MGSTRARDGGVGRLPTRQVPASFAFGWIRAKEIHSRWNGYYKSQGEMDQLFVTGWKASTDSLHVGGISLVIPGKRL